MFLAYVVAEINVIKKRDRAVAALHMAIRSVLREPGPNAVRLI
jgi:hypothetical protein